MKIIIPGKLPEEEVFRATCSNCKCKFEFKRKEAKYSSHRDESYLTVICPTEGCNWKVSREI